MKAIGVIESTRGWQRQVVDHGVLAFDRDSGTNVLLRSKATYGLVRRVPRVLQIGLLSLCNLHCDFCYRDAIAPNRLDAAFLLDLLRRAADWGVLEVAFGGGEPLMFPGFVDLVQRLHEQTSLGVNLTTNGTLLSRRVLDELASSVGEFRLSAYRENHYRSTLRMLGAHNVGVNWLVTPANVGMLEAHVLDCFALGARNVLLLGYKGKDPALHLGPSHLETLKRAVLRMQRLPLRLDGCWYPLLAELPHLFAKQDCGAGDEFLVITPDRCVQPCSFHHQKAPFETFEELQRIYEGFRAQRQPSSIAGCTRHLFPNAKPVVPRAATAAWVWQARASNNSGDWTIVGRFQTAEEAQEAAESLRELARAHEAFLASVEGRQWLEKIGYKGNTPSPPLRLFGQSHGFDWTGEGEGLWWEEDGCGAPVLTAGAVGSSIVVYHPYCMGLPKRPFKDFFANVGAIEFGYWQYHCPAVVASAKGNNAAAAKSLRDYLAVVAAAEYSSLAKTPPPWGDKCDDPRVLNDEDQSARLASGHGAIEQEGDRLHVALTFENTFAGALALESWLTAIGYEQIEIEIDDVLTALDTTAVTKTAPKRGLFGDVRPIAQRLEGAPSEKVVELVFDYQSDMPIELAQALKAIPPELRLELCRTFWEQSRTIGRDVTWQTLLVIQDLGPIAAEWTRVIWRELIAQNRDYAGFATKSLVASLPPDEAFDLANAWAKQAVDRGTRKTRLMAFGKLSHRQTLELISQWWEAEDQAAPIKEEWGRLAADSRLTWAVAENWLQRGRPLSLVALDALLNYLPRRGYYQAARPKDFGLPNANVFRDVLNRQRERDTSPRVAHAVQCLIEHVEAFADRGS